MTLTDPNPARKKSAHDKDFFNLEDFEEQSTGQSADSVAMAYITVKRKSDSAIFCGAGQHSNIDWAAIYALIAALNKAAGDL